MLLSGINEKEKLFGKPRDMAELAAEGGGTNVLNENPPQLAPQV